MAENKIPCVGDPHRGCQNGNGWATAKFACPAHFTPCGEVCPMEGGIDLYCTDGPCYGQNTTANPYLYAREMTKLIRGQAARDSTALFVYLGKPSAPLLPLRRLFPPSEASALPTAQRYTTSTSPSSHRPSSSRSIPSLITTTATTRAGSTTACTAPLNSS